MNARRQLTEAARRIKAAEAMALLIAHPLFKMSMHIACYLALEEEFDCTSIIHAIWAANKKCYVPVLSKAPGKQLMFVSYLKDSVLQPNRYGISEPVSQDTIAPEALDLVLLPLVGFDLAANRLGWGSGYYDATFSFLLSSARGNPFLLGVGYALQQVDQLPNEQQDVKLDGVLTEHRLIIFNSPNFHHINKP